MKETNNTVKSILLNSLMASVGLFFFGFGVYLTIQANLGVAPWEVFNLGLSGTFGIKYGTASIMVSLVILVIDILLREQIGLGMFLDTVIVGKTVDLFNAINLVPPLNSLVLGIIVSIAGMLIMGFSQYFYMRAALGCGPRDTLLVGLCRKMKKIPIGFISVGIMITVTIIGWLLGGPIGVGTILCAALEGPLMQLAFIIMRFLPVKVKHQNVFESFKVLFARKGK